MDIRTTRILRCPHGGAAADRPDAGGPWRRALALAPLLAATALLAGGGAFAQPAYPTATPVTMVVGWPAGGPSDNVARLIANAMGRTLGQSVVIDNRAGAGGNIGSDIAAKARPDGYTIMLATATSHGLNSALYAKLNHDPIKDFAPVGMIASSPSVLLVPAASPFRTVADVLARARANPGQLNYASAGVGSSQHLAGARFVKLASVDIPHIPYKGTAPAMTDVMAGRVDMILTTGAVSFVRSGKVRAVAVASKQRLPALPEVPTFDEAGLKGFHTDSWYGLVAPAGTPQPILDQLNTALQKALQQPEVRTQLAELGALPAAPMTTGAFWTFVRQQMPEAAELVRTSGAKVE